MNICASRIHEREYDVTFHMIDGDERNVPHGGERFCEIEGEKKGGLEAGAGCDSDSVNIRFLKFQQKGDYQCEKLGFAFEHLFQRNKRGAGGGHRVWEKYAGLFECLVQKRDEIFGMLALGEIGEHAAVLGVQCRL